MAAALATPVLCPACGEAFEPGHNCSLNDVPADRQTTEPEAQEPYSAPTIETYLPTQKVQMLKRTRLPRKWTSAYVTPGCTIGSYRILEVLGEGGVGRVFRAEHMALGRHVAIKMLRSEFANDPVVVHRFFGEARVVNKIAHPHIVAVTDFVSGDDSGQSYFVMELLNGVGLDELLMRTGNLPVERTLDIALQISQALSAVHAHRIVHRDLKPGNIFLVPEESGGDFVKILDFGVAKLSNLDDSFDFYKTTPGALLGTPEFMSPEQAMGDEVDHRTDIYALGVLLYEMVCGVRPFAGRSLEEVINLHQRGETVPPSQAGCRPSLPRSLELLILRCLEKKPNDRPQLASDVSEALLKIRNGEHGQVRRHDDTAPMIRPITRRTRGPGPLALAASVLFGALCVASVHPKTRRNASAWYELISNRARAAMTKREPQPLEPVVLASSRAEIDTVSVRAEPVAASSCEEPLESREPPPIQEEVAQAAKEASSKKRSTRAKVSKSDQAASKAKRSKRRARKPLRSRRARRKR